MNATPGSDVPATAGAGVAREDASVAPEDASVAPEDASVAHEHAGVGTYLTIAAVLTVITALEVGVIYVRQLSPIVVPLLLGMSLAKFALVVLFFMHLRYDRRVLAVLFVGPLVIAIGLAVALMTLPGAFLLFRR